MSLGRFFATILACVAPSIVKGDALPIEPGSWTLVVLPDTQNYRNELGTLDHFHAQTQWIADHVQSHNIKYALHEGDIVDRNITTYWNEALPAISRLNGSVPYALAVGDHDIQLGGTQPRASLLNSSSYFGPGTFYANQPSVHFFQKDRTDNSYHTFNAGGNDWLVLSLEYAPRDQIIAWANQVADAHSDHLMMLLTHSYLYYDDTRYDWHTKGDSQQWSVYTGNSLGAMPGGVNDGEEIWQSLVSRHPNFRFTFNGHALGDGEGFLTSSGIYRNNVHQMLANYQHIGQGGQGYFRLLEFRPDGTVEVSTYSPSLDAYHPGAAHHFTVSVKGPQMPGDFNNDQVVDAADYVAWRKVGGSAASYGDWGAHFGYTPDSAISVPEITSPTPLLWIASFVWRRRIDQ